MLSTTASSQPAAAFLDGAYTRRPQTHSTGSERLVAVVACMLFVCLSGSAAALTCDGTQGVTMTARHYKNDLEKMPDWSDTECLAEETRTVNTISWPVSATDDFSITIDGDDYDSNVAIVFEAYFDIPFAFTKFFQLNSTDGSKLFIDDVLVIDHDGLHDYIGSTTQKWTTGPITGPTRFKMTVQYFKGAISTGSGLAVSWGELRQPYAAPIPASELKLNDCTANVASPPPAGLPPPSSPSPPPPDTRLTVPVPSSKSGRPVKRTLPKACHGRCARGPQHRHKKPPPPHKLPKACHGKCNKKVRHKRKLPKACGGRCATMKPKTKTPPPSGRK